MVRYSSVKSRLCIFHTIIIVCFSLICNNVKKPEGFQLVELLVELLVGLLVEQEDPQDLWEVPLEEWVVGPSSHLIPVIC